jgi:hypothetical protein
LRSLPLQIPLILVAQLFTKAALTAAGASTVQFGGDNFLSVDLRPGGEEEEVTEAQDVSLRFRTQEKSGMEPNNSLSAPYLTERDILCSDKKENQIFLIYEEVQNGAVAKVLYD